MQILLFVSFADSLDFKGKGFSSVENLLEGSPLTGKEVHGFVKLLVDDE